MTNPDIVKVAHNISFESMFSYAKSIVIQAPVYDTMCASQMTLKGSYQFRKLSESGLKLLADELCHEPLPTFEEVTNGRFFDELDGQAWETVRYGAADSDFALRLYYIFNEWFDKYLPKHRYIVEEIESPTAVYLGIMKFNGVPIDTKLMQNSGMKQEIFLIPNATTAAFFPRRTARPTMRWKSRFVSEGEHIQCGQSYVSQFQTA